MKALIETAAQRPLAIIRLRTAGGFFLDRAIHESDLPLTLGRGKASGQWLPFGGVSRSHCTIDRRPGKKGLWLRDLGSHYGTFLTGRQVKRIRLRNEDMLTMGLVSLSVYLGPEEISDQVEPRRETLPRLNIAKLEVPAPASKRLAVNRPRAVASPAL